MAGCDGGGVGCFFLFLPSCEMQVHEFGLGAVSGGGGKERCLEVLGEGQWLVVVE